MIQLVVRSEDAVMEGILAAAQAAGPDLKDQKDALKAALCWLEAACAPEQYTSVVDVSGAVCQVRLRLGDSPSLASDTVHTS
jgi:hypothetical protein